MVESNKRGRGFSAHENDLTMEDITIMKLMEEIMEYDQEIKMKQEWINNRMKMLHKILPKQESNAKKSQIEAFLMKLQPEYPKKIKAYEAAIPLGMDSGSPIAMPMDSGEPIAMQAQDEPKEKAE